MSSKSKVWKSSEEVKKMFSSTCHHSEKTYERAMEALNKLEPNPTLFDKSLQKKQYKKHDKSNTDLIEFKRFLERIDGFTVDSLETLSVIHVAGSKGKGSVSTYTEASLREHKVKTGLFTSPHLISVTERIKIEGVPISEQLFNEYFWKIYDALQSKKDDDDDLPSYFKFLTMMALYIFLHENVEVAILEVGVGGECCPTNIVRNTEVVGITALQLEHTALLGGTIEEIAWQKAGIIKEDSIVFSLPQTSSALRVINERFIERKGKLLAVVPPYGEKMWTNLQPKFDSDIQKSNFSLAIQISAAWLRNHGKLPDEYFDGEVLHSCDDKFVNAFNKCQFSGRFQQIERDNATYYLDGAHTKESMEICSRWFLNKIARTEEAINILVFNVTGDRDSAAILSSLHSIHFHHVCFTTNSSTPNEIKETEKKIDKGNFSDVVKKNPQIDRCKLHKDMWQRFNPSSYEESQVNVCSSIQEVLQIIESIKVKNQKTQVNVLFTGSLYLVGSTLRLLG